MMTSVALLLCVFGAVSALPVYNPNAPVLTSRTEQHDDAGQYSRSYYLSDGQAVQETGSFKPNNGNDGYVLVKRGSYQHPTPEGMIVQVEYLADETGFHILSSNAVPVAPSPITPTF